MYKAEGPHLVRGGWVEEVGAVTDTSSCVWGHKGGEAKALDLRYRALEIRPVLRDAISPEHSGVQRHNTLKGKGV